MKRPTLPSLLPCLAAAVATVLAPASIHASGGFDEAPLTSLPDFLKLDALPAKTYGQILEETAAAEPELLDVEVNEEVAALKGMTGAQALAHIDKLVPRARANGNYSALKLLNDLRDLYAGPASAKETAEYVEFRTGENSSDAAALDQKLKTASPALRPHYMYLRGAAIFQEHQDTESQLWFDRIVKEFPKHPRAEIALYMSGRCQISRARTQNYTQDSPDLNQAQRPRGKQLIEQYLAKYPKGRWAGDALGWLGAWYYDGGDFPNALHCYLGQIDLPDHPELAVSAEIMCEKSLSHLVSAPKEKAWADVVKHPPAAQALVYLLLNSSESDNYNGKLDPADEVRAWRKKLLPQVAAAIAAQESLYKDAIWRPRYLATLALAASGAGQQDQALKLLETSGADAETDDLLLARGVVLQRARRSAEAIPVLRKLVEKFPKSPLIRGARVRIGLALADNHQTGEAIFEFDRLLAKPEADAAAPNNADVSDSASSAIYSDVADEQIRQMIDFWLNFAPIEELAAPALAPGVDPVQKLRFTEPIAQRLLAKEQFEEARKYMTPAQFDLFAGPIARLTKAAGDAKEPAARAKACLALGDAWAAARGKMLTYPLDTDKTRKDFYPNEEAFAGVRRADAAAALNYPGNYRLDLDNRDELRHAFNWWIEASDAEPGTALTATALWKALRAMPLVADVSPYTYERARARKWDDVSRKLSDRLRTECADTVEAKRYAVHWSFPGPKRPKADEYVSIGRDAAGTLLPAMQVFGLEENHWPNDDKERGNLASEIQQLVNAAQKEKPEAVRARLEKQRDQARVKFTGLYNARWVNFYEDLATFFSETDTSPEVRAQYVQLRALFLEKTAIGGGWEDQHGDPDAELQKKIDAALADPKTKPVADYFEFLKLAIIANQFTSVVAQNIPKSKEAEVLDKGDGDTYRSRDYPLLAKETKAFLAKFPKSKKREAALLLQARAIYRGSADVTLRNYVSWPQGARWEGGYLSTTSSQEPFDAKRVQAALDAYDRDFPKGRYAGDIRDYRAEVALRLHDWKTAVDLTAAQFDDPKRKDLQFAAATRLCEIFSQLADERYRADLIPAVKASPRGRELLLKFLAYESDINPLQYLGAWIKEQVGAKR